MTNPFYTHSDGVPQQGARGASAPIRSDFDQIASGFDIVFGSFVDIGVVNAFQIAVPAALTSITDMLRIYVKAKFSTTGAAQITIGSLGTFQIKMPDGTNLVANSILAGQVFLIIYSATTGLFQYNPNSLLIAANGLPVTGGTLSGPINEFHGANIASAASINLTTATGNEVHITGNTGPITSIALADGYSRTVIFDSNPVLVHSATLFLSNAGQNIQVSPNDVAVFRGDVGGVTRLVSYSQANGQPLAAPLGSVIFTNQLYGAFAR